MTTQIILTVLCTIILIVSIFLAWYCKQCVRTSEKLKSDSLAAMRNCEMTFDSVIETADNQKVYFKSLSDKYRLCLHNAINQYRQSQKEKNRKLTFKTRRK